MSDHRRVFQLFPAPRTAFPKDDFRALVITPEPVHTSKVQIAWTYAVRYTAKGLDIPDYPAAIKMLLERHPSWTIIPEGPASIPVDLTIKEDDVLE